MIRLDSANYVSFPAQNPEYKKAQQVRYTIAGSADYTVGTVVNTAFKYTLLVSASASALGGGVSAGGLDSLRVSFNKTTALTFVTDEALTATGWLTVCRPQEQLNPTNYLMSIELVRAI